MAEGTPFTITNCNIISLDKEEKIGKGNKPYLLFKFKVDHPKAQGKEFAKFCFTSKPDDWPRVGKIISMTGKMEESGQYTNYTVKEIVYDQTSKSPPAEEDPFGEVPSEASNKTSSYPITKEQGICLSYYKDLMIARLAWDDHKTLPSVRDMGDQLAREGVLFYQDVVNNLKKLEK